MYHKNLVIQEGAIIISDAHFSHLRPQLQPFLQTLLSQTILPPQLLLFGDIFDALFGFIDYTQNQNKELITLINALCEKMEVVYLEGNHDFHLEKIFPKCRVVPIEQQPLACSFYNTQGVIAHGDFDGNFSYKLYTKLIRNKYVLQGLRVVDDMMGHAILNKIDAHLGKKDDCKVFEGFEKFMQHHTRLYQNYDFFIEGHFHQNTTLRVGDLNYINLGAFACNQRYFRVKSNKDNQLEVQEMRFESGD